MRTKAQRRKDVQIYLTNAVKHLRQAQRAGRARRQTSDDNRRLAVDKAYNATASAVKGLLLLAGKNLPWYTGESHSDAYAYQSKLRQRFVSTYVVTGKVDWNVDQRLSFSLNLQVRAQHRQDVEITTRDVTHATDLAQELIDLLEEMLSLDLEDQ
ncbi:MAG: hypothetical protein U9R15_15350 [Chloroflexota bacterium]|nr:hypothetical protein [Chloroflexota bacterium]